ncbi:hypothetical protein TPA0910_33190 [Streptomyces hygroscopicus subsp. sporocinereus]|uniref:Uncharacterized protein n=1 Tax=Streptomyces hygroscopicus TaxID=1912 RepID=A0ABQ3TZT0_STRHY|nr:hypothetical protein TPA0910_33190 [Streptomyces hygroscopicus]
MCAATIGFASQSVKARRMNSCRRPRDAPTAVGGKALGAADGARGLGGADGARGLGAAGVACRLGTMLSGRTAERVGFVGWRSLARGLAR